METGSQKVNGGGFRWLILGIVAAALAALVVGDLRGLDQLSGRRELYSHLPLVPLISAYFFWSTKRLIGQAATWCFPGGLGWMGLGAILCVYGLKTPPELGLVDRSSILVLGAVIVFQGAFISLFGLNAARAALFPLVFLFLLVPIPTFIEDFIVTTLQWGSTEASHLLFSLSGIPFLRDGFVFEVPGMKVEVAPQCGGIRSGLALIITCIVAGKIFLRSPWSRVVLVVASIPITVFKNGLRIVGLTLAGIYIDPRILSSELHRSGGIPFFILALAMMAPILWVLMRWEQSHWAWSSLLKIHKKARSSSGNSPRDQSENA